MYSYWNPPTFGIAKTVPFSDGFEFPRDTCVAVKAHVCPRLAIVMEVR